MEKVKGININQVVNGYILTLYYHDDGVFQREAQYVCMTWADVIHLLNAEYMTSSERKREPNAAKPVQ